jgi:hypothetical protein
MHPDEIARRLEAAGLAEVATGAFGGCVLPRGALDATVGGCIYGGVCSIWNGGLLLADPVVRVSRWSPWQALIWATGVGRPDG